MTDNNPANFPMGARLLTLEESQAADLGPLEQLVGTWRNLPITENTPPQGWNVISVPGGPGQPFVFEVIPYSEELKFSPVVIQAGNRGPVVNGDQVEQVIFGLMYEQQIVSECTTEFCQQRGFAAGTSIHAETGLFLNLGQPNGGYTIARLATIPHGNSVLALGNASQDQNPGNDFFPEASAIPFNLDNSRVGGLGYSDPIIGERQFSIFQQTDPNTFLKTTLGNSVITDMTTLSMSTLTPNASGGILNIPFIRSNVDAASMNAIFWIETIEGKEQLQLQYTQTINLVFPATGSANPIVWPHVTINTLVKDSGIDRGLSPAVSITRTSSV